MKTCSTCGETKALSDFYRRVASSDGLAPNCKGCRKDAKAAWLLNHPERFREMQRKAALKRNYGLSPVDFDTLLKKQNGGCAICSSTTREAKAISMWTTIMRLVRFAGCSALIVTWASANSRTTLASSKLRPHTLGDSNERLLTVVARSHQRHSDQR